MIPRLLSHCPMPGCNGDLRPHCAPHPSGRYSRTCDIVQCLKCDERGALDGRYWRSGFARIMAAINKMEKDLNS